MPEVKRQTVRGVDQFQKRVLDKMEDNYNKIDFRPELREVINQLIDEHRVYFEEERDPSGKAWPPLAPSTVAKKGHDTILVETGRLKESLTRVSRGGEAIREIFKEDLRHGLVFGTMVPHSIFHQEPRSGHLPERKHVGMEEFLLDALVEAVADKTIDALKP